MMKCVLVLFCFLLVGHSVAQGVSTCSEAEAEGDFKLIRDSGYLVLVWTKSFQDWMVKQRMNQLWLCFSITLDNYEQMYLANPPFNATNQWPLMCAWETGNITNPDFECSVWWADPVPFTIPKPNACKQSPYENNNDYDWARAICQK